MWPCPTAHVIATLDAATATFDDEQAAHAETRTALAQAQGERDTVVASRENMIAAAAAQIKVMSDRADAAEAALGQMREERAELIAHHEHHHEHEKLVDADLAAAREALDSAHAHARADARAYERDTARAAQKAAEARQIANQWRHDWAIASERALAAEATVGTLRMALTKIAKRYDAETAAWRISSQALATPAPTGEVGKK